MHVFDNIPNQDNLLKIGNVKMVLDGCSKDENDNWLKSEVGVSMFTQLFEKLPDFMRRDPNLLEMCTNLIFERIISFFPDKKFILNNFCFTILVVYELEDRFVVKYCGDGYIITQNKNKESPNMLDYIFLKSECKDGYPRYYVYNYIPNILYKNGVYFNERVFFKTEYENVGIATDGLEYLLNLEADIRKKFDENLINDKAGRIRVQIARNFESIKDDITICF